MTQVLQEIELSVVQGVVFDDLQLRVTGDKSDWTAVGEIMKSYGDRSLVVDWSFEPLVYDAVEDVTTITPYLTAVQTQQLPATQLYGLGRVKMCVTDIKLVQLSGQTELDRVEVLRAAVRVHPSATQVAVAG